MAEAGQKTHSAHNGCKTILRTKSKLKILFLRQKRRLCFALSLVAMVLILHLCWVSYVDRLVIPFPFYLQLWRNASCLECLRPMPARTGPQGSDHQARCPVPKYGAFPETRQVVFAKVHKAASSTVQNILLRFAMARNLSVLLPNHKATINQASPYIDRNAVVPHPEGKTMFDILCNHVVYDEKEISKYFPESAARVAIIREPMSQALSALVYFATRFPTRELWRGLSKHPDDPVNGFLNHPEDFSSETSQTNLEEFFVNNRMSVDLGLDLLDFKSSKQNQSKIRSFLKRLEAEFDLVLISDYFDESIILLRRYLHWSMKDIVYLRVNTAYRTQNNSVWNRKPNLTATTVSTFRRWAIYDYELYEHFLPIFFKKLKSECSFHEELNAFRLILKDVVTYCSNATAAKPHLLVPEGAWNGEFTVSPSDCRLMAAPEEDLVEVVRQTQRRRRAEFFRESRRRLSKKFKTSGKS
ncbi:hypothetical protein RRG08_013904 [Elysia crispata]|uniref:Sulfotransferase n=1 Tax=Elysia crispata TaxID=231223 RepID=A0AAE0XT57_9GAST|nr:hypothetical protein RRG08_013904 [Elysia crispata]